LEVLEWQKGNGLGDVKARRHEFLDGLRFRKLRVWRARGGRVSEEVDVDHAAAESAAQLWIKFRTVIDAVKGVVEHDDVDGVLGRIV
jgi:hypothetical protein